MKYVKISLEIVGGVILMNIDFNNGSKCITISISASAGFPVSAVGFSDSKDKIEGKLLEEIVHPEDYPSLAEVLSNVVSGKNRSISVHSRFPINAEYHWFYINATATFENGFVKSIDGIMFDVSEYLQHGGDDLVIREYNRRTIIKQNAVKYSEIPLADVVEIEYLMKIQQPFSKIKGLYSAIIDTNGNVIALGSKEFKRTSVENFTYSRKKTIRIEQQDNAFWIIASDKKPLVEENSPLLDILVKTVSRLANSFVMVLKEIDNSRSASKILGQNIEEQILLKNIYSTILESENTTEAIETLLKYVGGFFKVDRISIYINNKASLNKTYYWSKSGADFGHNRILNEDLYELIEELDINEAYFSKEDTIALPFSHTVKSYCACQLFGVGDKLGIIFFEDFTENRKWFLRETKLIRTVSQIFSTIVIRAMVERRLAASQDALKRLAFTDQVTGISNRARFENSLNKKIRNGEKGVVLALDITNFRKTSELYGVSYAEMLLKSIAEYINFLPFENKKVYKYSESVFTIILGDSRIENGVELAEKIIAKFKFPWYLDANQHMIHMGIGISQFPKNGITSVDVTKSAMLAMYRSKEFSRNSYAIYAKDLQLEVNFSKSLEERMKYAIENDFEGFSVVYQPVIDREGFVKSCEAFVRWEDEQNGCILTSVFIELAEYLGISDKIDAFVLDESCKAYVEYRKIYGNDFTISVNVTTHELQSRAIVNTVQNILEKYNLPPKSLILEVPESAQMNSINDTNASLAALRGIGVGIAADNFGKDYLSLSSLRNSFITMVKIDKNLFLDDDDAFSQTLAKSIINLAHCKNIEVCVKGIELEDEILKVCEFNADLTQGYYISEPLDENEMKNFNCHVYNVKNS